MSKLIELLRWAMFPLTLCFLLVASVLFVLAGILVPVRLGGLQMEWWPRRAAAEDKPAETGEEG